MLRPWLSLQFPAFGHRNFRLYTWGQVINLAGTRIHEVAAGWLMWQLTGSATWVGALAVAEIVPRILFWLFAGVVADRVDRRQLALWSQSLSAVQAGCLAALSSAGLVDVYVLLAFTALLGLNTAFWQPVRLAIIPQLIPEEALSSAVALSSVTANVARLLGPVVAGPVLVWGSVSMAFVLNSASFMAVVLAFWLMKLPSKSRVRQLRWKISGRELGMGFAVIASDPGVRVLMIFIAVFAVCVRPVSDLLPVFSEAVFEAGPGGIAAFTSAIGFGSLFSGLLVSRRQHLRGCTRVLALAGAVGALTTAVFALSSDLLLALVCVGVMGFGVTLANIVAQILLQSALDDAVRGRVLSLYSVLFGCAPAVGALAMGWSGDRIGIAAPVVVGAVIGCAACLFMYQQRKRLAVLLESRQLERPK